jgi:hypothetical protein
MTAVSEISPTLLLRRDAATPRLELVRTDGDGRRLACVTMTQEELRTIVLVARDLLRDMAAPLGAAR